jgi:hypothetical protein
LKAAVWNVPELASTVEDKDEVTVSCMVPPRGRNARSVTHVELIDSGACSGVSKATILCRMELTVQNKENWHNVQANHSNAGLYQARLQGN